MDSKNIIICNEKIDVSYSDILSLIALIISIIALYYTYKSFILKVGTKIRFSYSLTSNSDCDDKYISSIILENLKDKPIIIFKIYFRLGENYYLLIDDFEEDPLILKPFEAFKKNYQPLIYYDVNLKRINLNSLLDTEIEKTLILSTTNGKYEVKNYINHWDPVGLFFKNYLTLLIFPIRFIFNDKSYGNKIQYLVELTFYTGKTQTISFKKDDYNLKKFHNFQVTEAALKSKTSLKRFFNKHKKILKYKKIDIIDFQEEIEKNFNMSKIDNIQATYISKIKYEIIGGFFTWQEKRRINKLNKEMKLKQVSKTTHNKE